MAARGLMPSVCESHSVQATSSRRHDPAPAFSQNFIIEHKIAMQSTEIEKLVLENERLAASHGSLCHELVATRQEVQRIQVYTLEIQAENEFETKVLQEWISKMEADIQAGENLKKESQEANMAGKDLLASKKELDAEVQKLTADLQKAYDEVKSFPQMHSELESLRQEHQILQASFKYKKGLNIEQVEQMHGMDRNLMTMARELEKLWEEVAKIELRDQASYLYGRRRFSEANSHGGQGGLLGSYMDRYRRPQVQLSVVPVEGMAPIMGVAMLVPAADEPGEGPPTCERSTLLLNKSIQLCF